MYSSFPNVQSLGVMPGCAPYGQPMYGPDALLHQAWPPLSPDVLCANLVSVAVAEAGNWLAGFIPALFNAVLTPPFNGFPSMLQGAMPQFIPDRNAPGMVSFASLLAQQGTTDVFLAEEGARGQLLGQLRAPGDSMSWSTAGPGGQAVTATFYRTNLPTDDGSWLMQADVQHGDQVTSSQLVRMHEVIVDPRRPEQFRQRVAQGFNSCRHRLEQGEDVNPASFCANGARASGLVTAALFQDHCAYEHAHGWRSDGEMSAQILQRATNEFLTEGQLVRGPGFAAVPGKFLDPSFVGRETPKAAGTHIGTVADYASHSDDGSDTESGLGDEISSEAGSEVDSDMESLTDAVSLNASMLGRLRRASELADKPLIDLEPEPQAVPGPPASRPAKDLLMDREVPSLPELLQPLTPNPVAAAVPPTTHPKVAEPPTPPEPLRTATQPVPGPSTKPLPAEARLAAQRQAEERLAAERRADRLARQATTNLRAAAALHDLSIELQMKHAPSVPVPRRFKSEADLTHISASSLETAKLERNLASARKALSEPDLRKALEKRPMQEKMASLFDAIEQSQGPSATLTRFGAQLLGRKGGHLDETMINATGPLIDGLRRAHAKVESGWTEQQFIAKSLANSAKKAFDELPLKSQTRLINAFAEGGGELAIAQRARDNAAAEMAQMSRREGTLTKKFTNLQRRHEALHYGIAALESAVPKKPKTD
ncbi:hypothetical protein [Roseateles sp. MS654]|uniref:hypothetical protein n=1 Tax=Roseateles sp. MS654 TaxID=3412685 RepID=UPI003C2D7CBC